jgi:hypothetical protein
MIEISPYNYGRIQIVKTFVMSQFMYVSSVIHTPPQVVKMVNKLVFNFIWRSKRERLKRIVLMGTIANGGMQAPHFQTMVQAAILKWIKELADNTEDIWKLILEKRLNVLLYSNFSMKTTGLDKAGLPEFYRELLKLWSTMGNTLH